MTESPFEVKSFLRSLTHRPGVYRMLDAKHKVIYVGKARDLRKRVSTYFQKSVNEAKTAALVAQVAKVEVTVTNTEAEALLLEQGILAPLLRLGLAPQFLAVVRLGFRFRLLDDGLRLGFRLWLAHERRLGHGLGSAHRLGLRLRFHGLGFRLWFRIDR